MKNVLAMLPMLFGLSACLSEGIDNRSEKVESKNNKMDCLYKICLGDNVDTLKAKGCSIEGGENRYWSCPVKSWGTSATVETTSTGAIVTIDGLQGLTDGLRKQKDSPDYAMNEIVQTLEDGGWVKTEGCYWEDIGAKKVGFTLRKPDVIGVRCISSVGVSTRHPDYLGLMYPESMKDLDGSGGM